ncbi:tetratricopeptide repeat protein [Streptomyces murinus]|uniref:tetratricopeptide repeat protein n=1 Tax=Streptomyces murinus TaxID=33900 RepID=UPI0037F401B5
MQARDIVGGVHIHQESRPTGRRRIRPRQLPPLTAHFLGREADLRRLDALCARRPPRVPQVLVIHGLAGVGKTALALRWLHRHLDAFPDGQLHADLGGHSTADGGGPVTADAVLEAFLVALGAPSIPPGTAQRAALWRSLTAKLKLAVLLDDAASATQVRPLLSAGLSVLTVVTSRTSLTGLRVEGARGYRLEGLSTGSALELLAVGGGVRVGRERRAAREVVRLCGRLPLAVGLASAHLALRPHRSVSMLVRYLSQGQGVADTLRVNGESVIRTALDMSYGLLPPDPARLYRRMGLLPTDRYDSFLLAAVFPEDVRSAVSGHRSEAAVRVADAAVHTLVEANLLKETGPDVYEFHTVVRSHARRLGEERADVERRDVLNRLVDWCLATAAVAEDVLVPGHRLPGYDDLLHAVAPTPLDGPQEALRWLDTRRSALMGAVRHCAREGRHAHCWRLTDVMWPLFLRFRPTQLWIEAHRLGLDAARRCGARQGEGRMLTSGAIGLRAAGEYPEAAQWYRQALDMATDDGDPRLQAQAVNGLGHICLLTHRLDEARGYFETALRLREAIGYRRGAALSRRRLGETLLAGGDMTGAARCLRRALHELRSLGEDYEATRALALLGHVLCLAEDHDKGVRRLRQARAGFRAGGAAHSEHWEGRCLEWLGAAAESRGDRAEAALHYKAARKLFRRLDLTDAGRLDERLSRL